ncbi:MAG: deoxyribose-phosphate aldolase [Halobacteriales archaeon]
MKRHGTMNDPLSRIEHTILGPRTTPADVRRVLDEAAEHGLRACVPPSYVSLAAEHAPDVELATVVGFPHGTHTTETKIREAERAYTEGADELDMVARIGRLQAGEDGIVARDIEGVVGATPLPTKVIVETPLLSDAEKRRAAEVAADAGADYLKTATGFSGGGATVADVDLLSAYCPVKASGGIGSWEATRAMFEAGAARIGASSGVTIAREYSER